MIPDQETYQQQLIRMRDEAVTRATKAEANLRAAEDELKLWRQQGRRADRYRAAWQSALRRATAAEAEAQRQHADCASAEARIAAAHRFADEMATYCSPHGVASLYADRLRAVLDGAQP
ncbi:hypothetical protein [Kitasatospora sp. A2-31]|uniref:hypothetical protein n=1 Tax=Kitasatospora sp. A2-31 TaxID=2916414 RepID=UPI001EED25BE|nr:hypothetical protein [Kitasatospora sp. A2-31]MCG6499438.1 hypothetical protein [Kitasatospora sp. A2-31]